MEGRDTEAWVLNYKLGTVKCGHITKYNTRLHYHQTSKSVSSLIWDI